MPANVKEVKIRLSGEDAGASRTVDQLHRKLTELRQQAENPNLSFGQRLRARFREERLSGETAVAGLFGEKGIEVGLQRMLGGGVAAAGVMFAAHSLGELGKSVQELGKAALEGKKSQTEMAESLVRGIPVIGTAAGGIVDLIRGLQDLRAASVDVRSDERLDRMSAGSRREYERRVQPIISDLQYSAATRQELRSQVGGTDIGQMHGEQRKLAEELVRYREEGKKTVEEYWKKIEPLIGTQRVAMEQEQNAKLQAITREHWQRVAEIEVEARAEHNAREREAKGADIERANASEIRMLEARGNVLQAAELRIRNETSDKIEALMRENLKREQENPEEAAELQAQAMERTVVIEQEGLDKLAALHEQALTQDNRRRIEAHESELRDERQHQQRLADLFSETSIVRWQAAGQTLTAEREQKRRAYEKDIEDINENLRRARDKALENSDETLYGKLGDQAEQQIEARRNLYQAELDAMEHGESMRERRLSIERELTQVQIDRLRIEGTAGNAIANREAEKLDLQQRYIEKTEQLRRILQSDTATTAQKLAASAALAGLGRSYGLESRRIDLQGNAPLPIDAAAEEGRYLTGVQGLMGNNNQFKQQGDALAAAVKDAVKEVLPDAVRAAASAFGIYIPSTNQ